MPSHKDDESSYFTEFVTDPITIIFFRDKVVVVRYNGEVIERELESNSELSPDDEAKIDAGRQYWDRMAKGGDET